MNLPRQNNPEQLELKKSDLLSSGWSSDARKNAFERLSSTGFPTSRDEYWKYTNPVTLTKKIVDKSSVFKDQATDIFVSANPVKIVFVNGVFAPEKSDKFDTSEISIEQLSDVTGLDFHWAKDIYGRYEKLGQDPVSRPLATYNTAFANDGIVIHVKDCIERPINIMYENTDEYSDVILHHVIKIDDKAALTLLENGSAAARLNQVMEVELGDSATFNHVRILGRDHERRVVTHIFGELSNHSKFNSFTLTVNGVLTRNECFLNISGDSAAAHISGACVGDGDFHHDDTVFVTHDSVEAESRQVFKKVLRNGATGVFQGKILVKPNAQKTDGYQTSQSLLLDEDSQFLAKPELEIYADDVACSHGSTSGAIDEEALFYLTSRGISKPIAIDMLTMAFLAQAVEEIESENLKDIIRQLLVSWLDGHRD
jgi:Fe-S cluster assembly protein SufD